MEVIFKKAATIKTETRHHYRNIFERDHTTENSRKTQTSHLKHIFIVIRDILLWNKMNVEDIRKNLKTSSIGRLRRRERKVLTKFHNNLAINEASIVDTSFFYLNQFHKDWAINVITSLLTSSINAASRVFTR
ncbi:hypothetical protein DPMN_102851 [Dreissena polymorpha]|uniref:Uncharacterized protein n=1 Tax=Dreissena polymorpha TaxID=45954 RepID=A0A9D4K088_DREPO|nr:hypothetical protein DPMN_102851 [Dreissena polymorpha]